MHKQVVGFLFEYCWSNIFWIGYVNLDIITYLHTSNISFNWMNIMGKVARETCVTSSSFYPRTPRRILMPPRRRLRSQWGKFLN